MKWIGRLSSWSRPSQAVVLYPDGAEERGFHAKNAFADQFNITGGKARIIFDIGANTGQTAERYLELFRDATVYCFEPFPPSYNRLRERFTNEPRVRCFQLAISSTTGVRKFHTFTNCVTNSLLPPSEYVYDYVAPPEMGDTGLIEVDSVTLDDFCQRERIRHIDILKLDIQGGEAEAFRGAARLLYQRDVALVYTEVLFVPVYDGQGNFYEIASFLANHRYRLLDFYNFAYGEKGQLKWGDAIFLPSSK